ncbi:MAG: hypothetical protein ABI972_31105 [Acidobacteriota bacterium]
MRRRAALWQAAWCSCDDSVIDYFTRGGGLKRPAFQFYPADWRKDASLQSCSIAARGLWHELMCVMHESAPYGHLTLNGAAMPEDKAARLLGVELRDYRKLLVELEAAGVSSRTTNGILYSRRMVRDEALRDKRANGGKNGAEFGILGKEHGAKGGRPRNDKGGFETGHETGEQQPPLEPPPSSAVASASASSSLPHALETPQDSVRAGDPQGTGEKPHVNGKGKPRDSWATLAWATSTASTFGTPRIQGESDDAFIDRITTAANARMLAGKAEAKRRAS